MEEGCWKRGTGEEKNGVRGEETRGPRGTGSLALSGCPSPILGTAQPPELDFLNLLVIHNGRKSTGLGVSALRLTSVSLQACSHPASEPQILTALPASKYLGDPNQMQFN